jgi:hypothetical protein
MNEASEDDELERETEEERESSSIKKNKKNFLQIRKTICTFAAPIRGNKNKQSTLQR